MTLAIALVALIFALMAFGLALYTTIIHLAIKNSTHKIQYINPMTQEVPDLDEDYPEPSMDEELEKYNKEYSAEVKKEFAFFNDQDENDDPKYIRGL